MLTPRSARDRFNFNIKAVNRVNEHSPHPNTRQVQANGRNIRHRSLPGPASLVTHRSQQGLTPKPRTDENLRDCFDGLDAGRLRELQQVRMPMPGRITYGEHTAPDCPFPLGRRGDRPKAGGRLIGSVVAVVMVLLASGVPAAAQAGGYPDVEGGVHARSIAALASDGRGILAGTDCDGGLFCPDDPLLRWVMAVWLVRAVDGADPDPSGVSSFTDVSPVRWWAPYTNRLADLEVTRGCSEDPPRYCPDQSVTRAQMASFLARAFELPGGAPGRFSDTANSPHAENIDKLAAAGITAGCGQGRYCPDRPVTRAQMATFLARALKLVPLPGATSPADGYRLAYSTADPDYVDSYGFGNQIWMAGLQGGREAIGSYSSHGGAHPIFSPDGRWVAYGARDKAYVMGTDGQNVREVRSRGRWSFNFRWSPDSRYLVYNTAGGAGGSNWIERSDGRDKRSIGLLWRFSPDGRLALYSVFDEVDGERVYVHTVVEDLESGGQVTIDVDESNARYVEFTPDGRRVSWIAKNPNGVHQDLWIMDIDGSNRVKLLTAGLGNLPGSAKLRWSPDGSRFAYVRGYGIGTQFIVADAANGETIMNLGISKCNYLDWAPDSAHLVSDNHEGFVFNTLTGDTIRQRDLYTGDPRYGRIMSVRWSPDNQSFAYILEEEDPNNPVLPSDIFEEVSDLSRELWTDPYFPVSTQLWIADADGKNKRKLVDEVGAFRWSPDGKRIAYSTLSPVRFDEGGPLPRSVSALWITDSDGSNQWSVVAQPEYGRITLLGWLPS